MLRVKPAAVYAYVSRGRLIRQRAPGGRGSTLKAHAPRTAGGKRGADLAMRTRLTLIDQDRSYFRGTDSTEPTARHSYE